MSGRAGYPHTGERVPAARPYAGENTGFTDSCCGSHVGTSIDLHCGRGRGRHGDAHGNIGSPNTCYGASHSDADSPDASAPGRYRHRMRCWL